MEPNGITFVNENQENQNNGSHDIEAIENGMKNGIEDESSENSSEDEIGEKDEDGERQVNKENKSCTNSWLQLALIIPIVTAALGEALETALSEQKMGKSLNDTFILLIIFLTFLTELGINKKFVCDSVEESMKIINEKQLPDEIKDLQGWRLYSTYLATAIAIGYVSGFSDPLQNYFFALEVPDDLKLGNVPNIQIYSAAFAVLIAINGILVEAIPTLVEIGKAIMNTSSQHKKEETQYLYHSKWPSLFIGSLLGIASAFFDAANGIFVLDALSINMRNLPAVISLSVLSALNGLTDFCVNGVNTRDKTQEFIEFTADLFLHPEKHVGDHLPADKRFNKNLYLYFLAAAGIEAFLIYTRKGVTHMTIAEIEQKFQFELPLQNWVIETLATLIAAGPMVTDIESLFNTIKMITTYLNIARERFVNGCKQLYARAADCLGVKEAPPANENDDTHSLLHSSDSESSLGNDYPNEKTEKASLSTKHGSYDNFSDYSSDNEEKNKSLLACVSFFGRSRSNQRADNRQEVNEKRPSWCGIM